MKRSATLVSIAAVLAYFVAVSERSSIGVAAIEAADRFEANAAQLSTLTVLQLVIYAAMQIPVGVLLDRYGAKRLLVAGALLMAAGQLLVSSATVLTQAVIGRGILGAGDAFTFISMIRLINNWYQGPAATRRTQLYANFGQLGQVFSAVPFAYFLHHVGWSSAYLALAAFALFSALISILWISDSPSSDVSVRTPWKTVAHQLLDNFKNPGVRMAFWVHYVCQSSGSVFVLLWGFSFLVKAEGLDSITAGAMLSSFVAVGFLFGPILSQVCATRPELRHLLVIGQVTAIFVAWGLVLIWPGRSPIALLWVLIFALGSGGPASMIAFDFTRTLVPKKQLGSANGVVNMGGFIATFVVMFAVGLVLDTSLQNGISSQLFDLAGFKLAMLAQFAVLGFGLVMFLVERSKSSRSAVHSE